MLKDRVVIRSETGENVLFKVFRAYYHDNMPEIQPYYEHHHSELEIMAVQTGSGCYSCSGEDYEFQPGDVFMHSGNDIHCFTRISQEATLSLLVFQFEPRFIWYPGGEPFDYRYLQIFMGGDENSHLSRHIPAESSTAELINRLLAETFEECREQQPAYDLFVKANLMTILANLARYFQKDLNTKPNLIKTENMESLEKSMTYITNHLEEHMTLDEIAEVAGMSRSYYSTIFKMLNGVSVWTYITNKRIDMAQHLLETTTMSVTNICEKCGFNNISNFNRAFKKVTGVTPSKYRSES